MDVAHSTSAASLSKDDSYLCKAQRPRRMAGIAPGDQDCLDDAVNVPCGNWKTPVILESAGPALSVPDCDRFSVKHGIRFSLFGQMFSPKSGVRGLATLIPIQVVSCKSCICNDILTGIGLSTSSRI